LRLLHGVTASLPHSTVQQREGARQRPLPVAVAPPAKPAGSNPARSRCPSESPPSSMTVSVQELIQHQLLPRVSKPNRYLGHALGDVRKPLDPADVRVLIAFPDAYEIGLSNLAIRILHHVLHGRADTP